MPRTLIDGLDQIQSGTISRGDLCTSTSGSAVIAKIIAGAGISISSTGADAGTGDVTVALGSVPTSSLTGTLAAGQAPAYAGDMTTSAGSLTTAVNKIGGKAVTLGGALTLSGAFATTLTVTAATTLTLPTSGTLATVNGALGTPASATLTNCTGLPVSTGISGLGTGVAAALAAAVTGSGAIVLASGPTFIGNATFSAANAGVEIGSTSVANTPYLDFHSSGNAVDYDARIIASGGSTSAGGGTLTLAASSVSVSALNASGVISGNGSGLTNLSAAAFTYTSPGTGAVTRSVVSRLGDTISVKDFGAVGDGVADDTAAIQAAITYAMTVGAELFLPAGKYLITSGLTAFYLSPGDGDEKRVTIRGAGSGATEIIFNASSGTALAIKGWDGTKNVFLAYCHLRGFRIIRGAAALSTQRGLVLTACPWFEVDDVQINGMQYGFFGYDILSAKFSRLMCDSNVFGFTAQRQTLSNPNALTFDSCEFGLNTTYGVALADPTSALFLGCNFENNGTSGNSGSGGCFISCANGLTLDGAYAASFIGCYFEGNGGSADIYYNAGYSDGSSGLSVFGCTFNRITNADHGFVTNNIAMVLNGTTTAAKLTVVSNGFNGFNSYVADASRPYIAITTNGSALWQFSDGGGSNTYGNSTEAPTALNNQGPVATQSAMASCVCTFNGATGALYHGILNVGSVVRNGVGDYTILFATPLAYTFYAFSTSSNHIGSTIYAYYIGTNGLEIQAKDLSGNPIDPTYISVVCFGGV